MAPIPAYTPVVDTPMAEGNVTDIAVFVNVTKERSPFVIHEYEDSFNFTTLNNTKLYLHLYSDDPIVETLKSSTFDHPIFVKITFNRVDDEIISYNFDHVYKEYSSMDDLSVRMNVPLVNIHSLLEERKVILDKEKSDTIELLNAIKIKLDNMSQEALHSHPVSITLELDALLYKLNYNLLL